MYWGYGPSIEYAYSYLKQYVKGGCGVNVLRTPVDLYSQSPALELPLYTRWQLCMNFWKEKQGCLFNVTDVNRPQFVVGLV